eukprot:TRINITY_DN185_c0_g2_i6.p1 TRINITY_DN185_c0_g2~~TRINITY_DN185_c0_g2_i6.p1  ORF type:complete len:273 (+),score=38.41 TRINITY_DN185_c0_g2_i6:692-1510(+)
MWYQIFRREMIREQADAQYTLNMLFYYVDKRCFESWSDSLSPEDMNNLDIVLKHLDRQFPDTSTIMDKRDKFRQCTMIQEGVLDYSVRKEALWRIAYPERDPLTESDYFDAWFIGLPAVLRVRLTELHPDVNMGKANVTNMVAEAARLEKILLNNTPADYRSQFPKKSSTDSATTNSSTAKRANKSEEICRDFQRGKCPRGADCPYKHKKKSNGATKKEESSEKPQTPSDVGKPSKKLCRLFKETGTCHFGDDCKFSHETAGKVASAQTLKH